MSRELRTEQTCRIVFAEIINGYSRDSSESIFLKHYSEIDLSYTEFLRSKYEADGRKEGLLSEKEKLDLLKVKQHWTEEEEKTYQETRIEIDQLRFSLKGLVIPQQIEHLKGTIAAKEKAAYEDSSLRGKLLGTTVEQYAAKRASENHILRSFFKDPGLSIPYFSPEETDDLSHKDLGVFIDIYHTTHDVFFEKNFKRIAVCPFFLNGYNLCSENPLIFYGKPIAQLTLYQLALFGRGRYYKNILNEPEAKQPPEEFYADLDQVVKFYDQQYSIILGRRTNNQLIK